MYVYFLIQSLLDTERWFFFHDIGDQFLLYKVTEAIGVTHTLMFYNNDLKISMVLAKEAFYLNILYEVFSLRKKIMFNSFFIMLV